MVVSAETERSEKGYIDFRVGRVSDRNRLRLSEKKRSVPVRQRQKVQKLLRERQIKYKASFSARE